MIVSSVPINLSKILMQPKFFTSRLYDFFKRQKCKVQGTWSDEDFISKFVSVAVGQVPDEFSICIVDVNIASSIENFILAYCN